jgi:hypothetical protein
LSVLLAWCSTAGADGLSWKAPRGCPSEGALRERIERRLEHSLDDVNLDVAVAVSRPRGGRHVAVVALSGHPARRLEATRCDELTDAVAVVIARIAADALAAQQAAAEQMTIDESAIVIDTPPHRDRAERDTDSPFAAPPPDHDAPAPAPSSGYVPKRWSISARMSGVSGIGVIPQVGLGGELAVSVRAGEHLAELGASRWVTSAAQFHAGRQTRIDVNLDATIARYGWRPPELPMRAWATVERGTMHTGGAVAVGSDRWLAVGTGFGIAWQMKPWIRLFGSVETMFALERARYTTEQGMAIWAPAPMSVRTTCGLEVGWQ